MCPRRRFLIAPDSFKGCLSSAEVAEAMAAPLIKSGAEVLTLPLSDGGEGMLDALSAASIVRLINAEVHDPLGREISANFGVMQDGTAVVESAEACGYSLLAPEERNPLVATSAGLGELILAAHKFGCRNFIVGLGGTSTSDSGDGMIDVLMKARLPRDCRFTIAVDVDAPLLGARGATYTFARQKGASEADLSILEERAANFARKSELITSRDMKDAPGAGAAGGLGYAFMQYFDAEVKSGAELMLQLLDFDTLASKCEVVITGEGRSDAQTLMGKLPAVVMRHARKLGREVWLVSGAIDNTEELMQSGFNRVEAVTPTSMPLAEALVPSVAYENIKISLSSSQMLK